MRKKFVKNGVPSGRKRRISEEWVSAPLVLVSLTSYMEHRAFADMGFMPDDFF